MIFDNLEDFHENSALINDNSSITYKELISLSDSLCDTIPSRSIVLLFCDNSIESLCAYIGFLRNRIVPIMVNNKTDLGSVANIIKRFQPNYIFNCVDSFNMLGYNILVNNAKYRIYEAIDKTRTIVVDNLALLLTTSGSTGSPKFVKISYENLESNTSSICKYLNISASDRAITSLPIFYSFGLSIINTHLYAGASLVVTNESFLSRSFWTSVKENSVTTFSGVPYSFSILKKLNLDNFDLSTIKNITQAGGKLDKGLVLFWEEYFRNKNIKFYVMYGQTEATARMSYVPQSEIRSKPGSIGVPIPNGSFLIYDENDLIQQDNEVGELVYTGKNVCLGYADNFRDLSCGDINNGKLYTGDLAYRDEDGYFYIVGRKKRFLKLFGNRVNLDELEGNLKSEGIECLCSGEDDCLRIYITSSQFKESINTYILNRTLINPISYRVIVIDEFPISDSGKVLYSELS